MAAGPTPVDPFILRQLSTETEVRARLLHAETSTADGAPTELMTMLEQAVDGLRDELLAASHDLAANPEVAFEEHRSSAALAGIVEGHGIGVTRGAHGLPTALRAEVGPTEAGMATIAILSEYDALPDIGHGCGHNIIATAGLGAFLALASLGDQLGGRVVWLGTPAEEGGSGKELMALDALSLMLRRQLWCTPSPTTSPTRCSSAAVSSAPPSPASPRMPPRSRSWAATHSTQ